MKKKRAQEKKFISFFIFIAVKYNLFVLFFFMYPPPGTGLNVAIYLGLILSSSRSCTDCKLTFKVIFPLFANRNVCVPISSCVFSVDRITFELFNGIYSRKAILIRSMCGFDCHVASLRMHFFSICSCSSLGMLPEQHGCDNKFSLA